MAASFPIDAEGNDPEVLQSKDCCCEETGKSDMCYLAEWMRFALNVDATC